MVCFLVPGVPDPHLVDLRSGGKEHFTRNRIFLPRMRLSSTASLIVLAVCGAVQAQVPQLINYQGRMTVGGTNFTGTGQFQFAFVNNGATQTYWSNGTGIVSVPVTKGLYSVFLGDTGMNPIPSSVFTNSDIRLRVWFNDGISGNQLLSPDQRITASGYAFMAANVPDGSITSSKLAPSLSNSIVSRQVSSTNQQALANNGYLLTNAAPSVVTLPVSPSIGDTIRISGAGAGGWRLAQNSGQSILSLSDALKVGWTPSESNRQWYSVASSIDGVKLVAVVNNGWIYRSTDSGVTWTPSQTIFAWWAVASSADGTKLVAVGDGDPICTSTNSGITWVQRWGPANYSSIASSADGNKLVATVYLGNILTSANAGVNWTPRLGPLGWTAVASSADGIKLGATVYGGYIYTSTNSGVNWTAKGSALNWNSITSSADGTKLVATVAGGQIYLSRDSGATWIPRESSRNWTYVASSSDGTILAATVSGGMIYISTDSGETWSPTESNRGWVGIAMSANGRKLVAVPIGDKIYNTSLYTTTTGSSGYLSGSQGSAIELQYIGNNQWMPLSHEGTITSY